MLGERAAQALANLNAMLCANVSHVERVSVSHTGRHPNDPVVMFFIQILMPREALHWCSNPAQVEHDQPPHQHISASRLFIAKKTRIKERELVTDLVFNRRADSTERMTDRTEYEKEVKLARKEGRALGEVTKFMVYNARKRQQGGDTAQNYFKRTEMIAGVQDMRFQELMPDALLWLGVTKIDRFISMSDMKYNAIAGAGIKVIERVALPEHLVPADAQVEINRTTLVDREVTKLIAEERRQIANLTSQRDIFRVCTTDVHGCHAL